MFSTTRLFGPGLIFKPGLAVLIMAVSALGSVAAHAEEDFPFGFEMTMEVAPQPGTKRMPTLEIGDNGEATLDLWCKHGKGQFSVAGNTVVFVPGPMEERGCAPDRAAVDDETVAALTQAATWKRQGDLVSFIGTRSVRFRINTN
jgi:heat shock protein HslJ